jgi:hypothetical protein
MPSTRKEGHTALLVQVETKIHAAADARRRRERVTWSKVIATLLQRWADGDEAALSASVRKPRLVQAPPEPGTARAQYLALSERWDREDPEHAKRLAAPVDISKLTRYRSLGALLAAEGAKAGRVMSPQVQAAIDAEVDVIESDVRADPVR